MTESSFVQARSVASCEFSRELRKAQCHVQRLLIGDFSRTNSKDERRGHLTNQVEERFSQLVFHHC